MNTRPPCKPGCTCRVCWLEAEAKAVAEETGIPVDHLLRAAKTVRRLKGWWDWLVPGKGKE